MTPNPYDLSQRKPMTTRNPAEIDLRKINPYDLSEFKKIREHTLRQIKPYIRKDINPYDASQR